MCDELWDLLKERGLDKEKIEIMKGENIDCAAISSMEDETLQKYITKHGDRMVVRKFCERMSVKNEDSLSEAAKDLRNLLANKNKKVRTGLKVFDNKNAKKNERRVEVGWINFDKNEYKQVRYRNGGGTRHIKLAINTTIQEVQKQAENLFFQNGISRKGPLSSFEAHMMDFSEEFLQPSTTVGDLYDQKHVKILRIYLATKKITNLDYSSNEEEFTEDNVGVLEEKHQPTVKTATHVDQNNIQREEFPDICFQSTSKIGTTDIDQNNLILDTVLPDISLQATPKQGTSKIDHNNSVLHEEMQDGLQSPDISDMDQTNIEHNEDSWNNLLEIAISRSLLDLHDPEVQFGNTSGISNNEDTLPLNDTIVTETLPTNMKLHRGHVFKEMNDALESGLISERTSAIEVTMILSNGDVEQGEDSGGVLRDCFSEYFDTFYDKCTKGNSIKVPVVRHDMRYQWENVAKMIVLSYKLVGYFPVALASVFLDYCLDEKNENDCDLLIKEFMETVPDSEREILQEALRDFKEVEKNSYEEFPDVLESHNVRLMVTAGNFKEVLSDVSHAELIQEPAFIAEQWRPIFLNSLKPLLQNGSFAEIKSKLSPNARKVISMVDFEGNIESPKERHTADLLKKYIRQMPKDMLKKFIRFCTGSNLLMKEKIFVRFYSPTSEFVRRPIAHTCGCVLEMPNNYQDLMEMKEEFNKILNANVWVMDIV